MAITRVVKIMPRISRRMRFSSPDEGHLWHKHAHQVGEIITAWNDLQASLFSMFAEVLGVREELALAIWHTVLSDSVQREMLVAAADAKFHHDNSMRILPKIRWLKTTIDKIAKSRNDPAHTPITFASLWTLGNLSAEGNPSVVPDWFTGKRTAVNRLLNNPLEENWRKIRGDLVVLTAYSTALKHFIRTGGSIPLPHRPRLLSLPKSKPRKRRRRLAHEKRQRQP